MTLEGELKIINKEEIKKTTEISVLIRNYTDIMFNFSCNPNEDEYPYPNLGDIINEERTVRWNREKVERLRLMYDNQVKRLNKTKNDLLNAIEEQIKTLAMKSYKLSKEEMNILWSNAYLWSKTYEEDHSSGIAEVYSYFSDFVNMYSDLLNVRKRE